MIQMTLLGVQASVQEVAGPDGTPGKLLTFTDQGVMVAVPLEHGPAEQLGQALTARASGLVVPAPELPTDLRPMNRAERRRR